MESIDVGELIVQEIGKAKEDIEKEVHKEVFKVVHKVVDSRLTELKTTLKTRIHEISQVKKLVKLEAKVKDIINGPGNDEAKIEQIDAIQEQLLGIQLEIPQEGTIRDLFIFVSCADDMLKYKASRQVFQKKLNFLETKFKGMEKPQLDQLVSQVDKGLNFMIGINQALENAQYPEAQDFALEIRNSKKKLKKLLENILSYRQKAESEEKFEHLITTRSVYGS